MMQPPDELTRRAAELLESTAQEVLETMFFAAADPVEPAPHWPGPALAARVDFAGHWTGRFDLRMLAQCAGTMAENFSGGPGDGAMADQQAAQILCELANMLCGATLSRLAPNGRFDLETPRMVSVAEPTAAAAPDGGPSRVEVERWLDAGEGPLQLFLEWEARP